MRPSSNRSRPPASAPPPAARFPPFLHAELVPGLAVFSAATSRAPLVTLELILPGGGDADPSDPVALAGLATLTASLLDEGTPRLTSEEIARSIERLGGYLTTSADWDSTYLRIGLLARHLEAGLAVLAELALDPSFPPAEVARLRRQREAELLRRRDQPGAVAEEHLARTIYGDAPYGHTLLGDEASLARIRREDCVAFHRRRCALPGAALVVGGDVQPATLLAQARRAFAGWPPVAAAAPAPALPPPIVPLSASRVRIVDRPGAAQTELRIGHAGVPRTAPDHAVLTVLNSLLGGKFTSRLNLTLRERYGYTYGVSSRFSARRGAGPFVVAAAVSTAAAGAAAKETLAELRRLREEPVAAAELEETRSYLLGVFPYGLQTGGDLVAHLEDLAVFGLGDDAYDRYLETLRGLSAEDVLRAARAHLHPDACALVAVGPAAELAPQFAELGPVEIR